MKGLLLLGVSCAALVALCGSGVQSVPVPQVSIDFLLKPEDESPAEVQPVVTEQQTNAQVPAAQAPLTAEREPAPVSEEPTEPQTEAPKPAIPIPLAPVELAASEAAEAIDAADPNDVQRQARFGDTDDQQIITPGQEDVSENETQGGDERWSQKPIIAEAGGEQQRQVPAATPEEDEKDKVFAANVNKFINDLVDEVLAERKQQVLQEQSTLLPPDSHEISKEENDHSEEDIDSHGSNENDSNEQIPSTTVTPDKKNYGHNHPPGFGGWRKGGFPGFKFNGPPPQWHQGWQHDHDHDHDHDHPPHDHDRGHHHYPHGPDGFHGHGFHRAGQWQWH